MSYFNIHQHLDEQLYTELVLPLNEHFKSYEFNRDVVEGFIRTNYPKKLPRTPLALVKETYISLGLSSASIKEFGHPDNLFGFSIKKFGVPVYIYFIDNTGNIIFYKFKRYNRRKYDLDAVAELDGIFLYKGRPIGIEVGRVAKNNEDFKNRLLTNAYGQEAVTFRFIFSNNMFSPGLTDTGVLFHIAYDHRFNDLAKSLSQHNS
ncbi:MAG: hypothetical protein HY831_03555 [Candidatus Aenigmarchaeota archaeon]|nr:hypothetical protein [Candidatus Aenigmarchaeota archaeon]